MSAEVDQGSAVEPHKIEMSAKNTSSGASSTSGPRTSIFAAKSGFVIPKNKLSGSLIPIFRGVKKPGNDAANDGSTNQVRRKSKWGPDPTQDAAVRRGKALAYQTRIDQITQQLMSGLLEPEETQSSQAAELPTNSNLCAPHMDAKVPEMLKLERQEIIGEILKLNPSFKTPPDYVPLLKEATVSIPVKDYPGFNFVGLIFGPGSETQKRSEKETKAKVQVFGTKANTGEKVEISASNVDESQDGYEELNVHVSADTFEKVDEAVSLIELLLSSVSENIGGGNNQNAVNQNEASSAQETVRPAQTPQQDEFHFQNDSRPSFYGAQPGFGGTSFVQPQMQMQTQAPSYRHPPRNFHIPVIPRQTPSFSLPERPLSSPGWPRPMTPQAAFSAGPMNQLGSPRVPISSLLNSPQQPTGMRGPLNSPQPPSGMRGSFPGDFTFRPQHPLPPNQDFPSPLRLAPPNPPAMHMFPGPAQRLPFVGPPVRSLNQRPDFAGPLPPLPGLQRMVPPVPPNQQLTANPFFASNPGLGGGQIYDPFSPTSTK